MSVQLETGAERFFTQCNETLAWLGATEALWLTAPPTTEIRRNLRVTQLEALYEAAFLRIFTAWEVTLEDLVLRMMAKAGTPSWIAAPASGKSLHPSIASARAALYGNRDFLLWHNPLKVTTRISGVLLNSPLEVELVASAAWLENVGHVRHRIAHSSPDASRNFQIAAASIGGGSFRGSPGRFLRSEDLADPLNRTKWIVKIDEGLRRIVRAALK